MEFLKKNFMLLVICSFLLATNLSDAAQFHVTTALELETALATAQENGQNDTVYLAAGQYTGDPAWGFKYNTITGDGSISIRAETGVIPSDVLLRSDNASSSPVLSILDLANPSNISVEGVTIEGGVSYAAVELATANGSIVVSDCIFKDNTGDTMGTLVASAIKDDIRSGGAVTFVRNTVTDNKGAINLSGRTITVSQNTISKNDSGVKAKGETVILTNNVITNNDGNEGVGISVSTVKNGGIYIINNTISENVAKSLGGGAYITISDSETVFFYNNIIWGNKADKGGDDIYLTNLLGQGYAYAYNNNYSKVGAAWNAASGNIDADPQFVNSASGDWRLSENSPCIDTGTNDALQLPLTDHEGNWRAFDGNGDGNAIVDMGAYEYGSSSSLQGPIANIQANGSGGPLNISTADPLFLTVALDPKSQIGINADWWILAATPAGWYHYTVVGGAWSWHPGLFVTYQGPIFAINELEILNVSQLPSGSYTFFFGVDMNMNGLLDLNPLFLFYDSVQVNVSN